MPDVKKFKDKDKGIIYTIKDQVARDNIQRVDATKYIKPDRGIPMSDLDPSVQDKINDNESSQQVQADWNQTNTQAVDYIKNKPSFKTINNESIVGNGNITITGGGTSVTVEDKLNSTNTTAALSANQGRILNETKQDIIQDLDSIRQGATLGATALQEGDIPERTSDLIKDDVYVKDEVYSKDEVYTKQEVINQIIASQPGGANANIASLHTAKQSNWQYYDPNGALVGDNINTDIFGVGALINMWNSIKITSEIASTKKVLPSRKYNDPTKYTYAHGPNIQYLNGKLFITCFVNDTDMVDDWTKCRAMMFIVNADTLEVESTHEVSEVTANGNTYIVHCLDPVLYLNKVPDNNTGEYTLTVCMTTGVNKDKNNNTNEYPTPIESITGEAVTAGYNYMVYRDFKFTFNSQNDVTGTWGDVYPCKLKASDNDTPVNFNRANFNDKMSTASGTTINIDGFPIFNMFSQYTQARTRYGTESSYHWKKEGPYYVAVGASTLLPNGLILTTTDFHTFTYWAIPEWRSESFKVIENGVTKYKLGMKYEMALEWTLLGSAPALRCAVRLDSGGKMFIGHIKLNSDGSYNQGIVDDANPGKYWRLIPDANSRPCLFSSNPNDDSNIATGILQGQYVMHCMSNGRTASAIESCKATSLSGAGLSRVATMNGANYPAIASVKANNKVTHYVAYQMLSGRVYISKFTNPVDEDTVMPAMKKFIDTFGPA